MKILKPSAEILQPHPTKEAVDEIYRNIEIAGRNCYQSENKITSDSAKKFVAALVKSGHEAMIEHAFMTVKFSVDRGISHELVRHRIASFAQSSTRYCNYSKDKFDNEIKVIEPYIIHSYNHQPEWIDVFVDNWLSCMKECEQHYMAMVNNGVPAEWARSVLPNSLQTNLIITANMREWRNIFKLRAAGCYGRPHPQMQEVMIPLLNQCKELMPELFGDIEAPEFVR